MIQGNYIGTKLAGLAALGNTGVGVNVAGGASGTIIGGSAAGAGNVISGSVGSNGVAVSGAGTDGTIIQGNFIGTDKNGTAALPNFFPGVAVINGAMHTQVGGLTATPGTGAGNVISGNLQHGILIRDLGTSNTLVRGNLIGLAAGGSSVLGNGTTGSYGGVVVFDGASNTTIGGTNPLARNVVSGNENFGITTLGSGGLIVTNTTIQGNYVGTNMSGTAAIPNGRPGIGILDKSATVTIGGTTANAGNLISGNAGGGVFVSNLLNTGAPTGVLIQGNRIGTNAAGTGAIPNTVAGIYTGAGIAIKEASNATVGGNLPGARNVISGNSGYGVYVLGSTSTGNTIAGNYIGLDANGLNPLGNESGVVVDSAVNTTIGSLIDTGANVISGNNGTTNGFSGNGVLLLGSPTTNIWGNTIGLNSAGTAPIGNLNHGVSTLGGATTTGLTIGGGIGGARNVIAGNLASQIALGSDGVQVSGNYISTTKNGLNAVSSGAGQDIYQSGNNITIGTNGDGINDDTEGNLIATVAVTLGSIYVFPGTDTTTIAGNRFGVSLSGNSQLGTTGRSSIYVAAGSSNVRIGTDANGTSDELEQNIISGGLEYAIIQQGTNTVIAGNYIGTNATGTTKLASPGTTGIALSGGNATIGGLTDVRRNIISGFNDAILISAAGSNTVLGNYIGTDKDGTGFIGNVRAITLDQSASANTIGGISPNVIGYSSSTGIEIRNTSATTTIINNYIGVSANGNAIPNAIGIHAMASSSSNAINDNVIRYSTNDNIWIESAGSVLRRNVSADMGGSPIKLNPASLAPGLVTVSQVVSGSNAIALINVAQARPSTTYIVDLFSSPMNGQASRYVTSGTVTTDPSGAASNVQIPLPTGLLNGYVHATLTGLGASGVTSTTALSTGVLGTPAIILGLPTQSPEGTPITLTAFSSTNAVTGYLWEVKKDGLPYAFELRTDGTQSDGGIQFTPDDEGNYTVSLRVTIADGTPNGTQSIIGPYNITVYNVAPTPSFSYTPTSIAAGTLVTLASNNSDPGQLDLLKNSWEVRSGSPSGPIVFSAPLSVVTTANFIPTSGGFYYATMTVDDGDGGVRTLTREIEASGLPSAAATTIIVPNTAVLEGQTVRARAPESLLNRSEQLNFSWTVSKTSPGGLPTDYTSQITIPSRGVVEFIPDDDGVYTIGLTVGDGVGTVNAVPQVVTVSNVAPRIQITGGANQLASGVPVILGSSISDPGAADTHSIAWSVTLNGAPFGTLATGTGTSFTPLVSGNYVVTASATDDDGGIGTTRRTFSLSASGVSVAINPPTGPFVENTSYNFTATVPAGATTYTWTARDVTGVQAGTGSTPSFAFTPLQGGDYQIELRVTFADGRIGNAIFLPMTVQGLAPTIISPLSVVSPTPIIYEGTAVTVRTLAADPREVIGLAYQWSLKKPGQSTFTTLSGVDGAPTDFNRVAGTVRRQTIAPPLPESHLQKPAP